MTDEPTHVEVSLWEGELKAPPERYAVPALTLPPLQLGTLVTYGEPGRWWAIDEGYAATPPEGVGDDETYGIVLLAEEAGLRLRPCVGAGPPVARLVTVPARDLWVYRDVTGDRDVSEVPEWSVSAWFDRVLTDDLTPPPIRRPRPARELPSLVGRRLRAYGAGAWHWLVAVSEPLSIDDSILVRVVDLHQFGPMLATRELPDGEPGAVSLHRLWSY